MRTPDHGTADAASPKTRRGTRVVRRFALTPGRVFRTADLSGATKNPSRLAKQWVAEGVIERSAHGLYGVPTASKFGRLTPRTADIVVAFLKGAPHRMTGPEYWNATGLGSTAVFPVQMVYNHTRSGRFTLGGRAFWFIRKACPSPPTAEWYAIDVIVHREIMGVSLETLRAGLRGAVQSGRLSAQGLRQTAAQWATQRVAAFVDESLRDGSPRDGSPRDGSPRDGVTSPDRKRNRG